ncbi:Tm-1-like ATP-binding domain-containing protein [uncultured Sulfitobacter sp.]|uniref:Tm-1-like ATP-binding domain-containing protein n=1 Tax=uncultured Sulfitobacter sp. TaxID=191468 RepID=UPI00261FB919|nr:Tm-1-like ATP-binding domain-containing protein [uncultured Sulfitobacter sp.]
MARVLLIGTFETKRQELSYLAAALRAHNLEVELLDVSLDSKGAIWSGAEKLAQMAARAEAAAMKIEERHVDCQVAIGVGGGTGGEIVLAAIKGLPQTYPKILITTLAFDPRPALADSSITIIPTLCDIEGLNTQLRQAFENAAAGVAGLVKARRVDRTDKQTIALTTLGATGPAGSQIARGLSDAGYETTVFHANGYGGAAFARFVREGHADGIIDLNVHELGRIHLAGAHVDMPERFTAGASLPRVVLPGALNFLGLGALETISPSYLDRPHYRHTNQFTHIKLTHDEMVAQATRLAAILNKLDDCHVILPMGGFSHEDRAGGAIEDEALRNIAAGVLENAARSYTIQRLTYHINAPETAHAAVGLLHSALTQRNNNV